MSNDYLQTDLSWLDEGEVVTKPTKSKANPNSTTSKDWLYKHGPEQRAKISAAMKGRPSSRKGKTHTAEARAKIGAASKGRSHTAEARAKIGAGKKGKTLSPEHRAKIGAGKKGKPKSAETRAKMSAGHRRYRIKTDGGKVYTGLHHQIAQQLGISGPTLRKRIKNNTYKEIK